MLIWGGQPSTRSDYHYLRGWGFGRLRSFFIVLRRAWWARQVRKLHAERVLRRRGD